MPGKKWWEFDFGNDGWEEVGGFEEAVEDLGRYKIKTAGQDDQRVQVSPN